MEQQLNNFLTFLGADKSYSDNTIAAYRNDLNQFIEYYLRQVSADVPGDWYGVDNGQIIGYILDLRDREYASSTVARKVAALKSFFHYLYERKLIPADPTAQLDSPKVKKRLPKTLSFADVERLLDAPPRTLSAKALRDRALLELLYASGMRVTEVVSMRTEHLDLAAGRVHCPGKRGKNRIIPIDARATQALALYLEHGRPQLTQDPEESSLFLNHRGQQLTRQGLWLIIKAYADAAHLEGEVTPHTLRHSFAAHKLHAGAELRQVQQLLGHANISTTLIYTQVANGGDDYKPQELSLAETV